MKQHPLSPEEKADYALENFQGINPVEPSAEFDAKMVSRFDSEFSIKSRTPKWFWAAAIAIFSINVIAAYNYSGTTSSTSSETKTTNTIGSYYFQGGMDWYQE